MRIFVNTLLLLLFSATSLLARFTFSIPLQESYKSIQNLQLEVASQQIASAKIQDPSNGIIYYLENYRDLHYLLLSEDRNSYSTFLKQVDARYDYIESLEESPYKRFIQAELKLHAAFTKLKFGNEISGCRDIIKAYSLLTQNQKKYPNFHPNLKSLGLLHVLIGCVPDKYTWVVKLIGLTGTINQGLSELELVQQHSDLFRYEAKLIDHMLHAYVLDSHLQVDDDLVLWCKNQPTNLLLHFLTVAILKKEGKTEEALQVLQMAPKGKKYLTIPVMDYMKAELLLHQGMYHLAIQQYEEFLSHYKGFNFIKDSYYKLFICYWLLNEENKGKRFIAKISDQGSTITEADQFAQRFAEQYQQGNILPELKPLYEARYYSDGGFQQKALKALQHSKEDSFTTIIGKSEFNYRKGRILQKSGQASRAIPYYMRAINLSEAHSYYFGATAALQLGYIYQESQQAALAKQFFKKAISFKKHEYKNSVDNKAKAALQKL